jgi:hypothetical protein
LSGRLLGDVDGLVRGQPWRVRRCGVLAGISTASLIGSTPTPYTVAVSQTADSASAARSQP